MMEGAVSKSIVTNTLLDSVDIVMSDVADEPRLELITELLGLAHQNT